MLAGPILSNTASMQNGGIRGKSEDRREQTTEAPKHALRILAALVRRGIERRLAVSVYCQRDRRRDRNTPILERGGAGERRCGAELYRTPQGPGSAERRGDEA